MSGQEVTFTLPHAAAGVMVLSLNAYVLLGGADFGGGVWDLFASGRHRDDQRRLIADAIGPIWEANHVWLILVVVLLFTCFPKAYAHLATELHIPLTLMLIGIVLRGSAFTFRTYDSTQDAVQHRWGRIFSVASVATPVLLGLCLGVVAAGRVPLDRFAPTSADRTMNAVSFATRYLEPWATSAFAWAVGFLTLALFAFLAATYLTVAAREPEMSELFRRRALQSQATLVALLFITVLLAASDAPTLFSALTSGVIAPVMHVATGLAAVGATVALLRRHYHVARLTAAAQASFIVWGWAWSQFPWLLPPDASIASLAAPRVTLVLVLAVLAVGTTILLPSFVYLYRVFRAGESAFEHE